MSLLSVWSSDKSQLIDKKVSQIISFAGDGKLRDGSSTSVEFREFLRIIPSNKLREYAIECLQEKFQDSGYVLQDIINEIGNRIGFEVTNGIYLGNKNKLNCDGIWKTPQSKFIVVEVKTTDAYRIKLDTIASYRKTFISRENQTNEDVSILLVVGREDTGGLEAQVRGSKYAWSIRIISIDALIKLMTVKEDLDNPDTVNKIFQVLLPKEYTKLDEIIEMIFSTAEGITESEGEIVDDFEEKSESHRKKIPVSFREGSIEFIQKQLGIDLVKRTKSLYSSIDNDIGLSIAISKEYVKNDSSGYWFAFHPYQKDFLKKCSKPFVAFGCGSSDNIILFPFEVFSAWLKKMNTTKDEKRVYWHVQILQKNGNFTLYLKARHENPDITAYHIKLDKNPVMSELIYQENTSG
ncbi:MAG: hypothetical protein RIG61_01465 [Deltaproteobacteria bacterium]